MKDTKMGVLIVGSVILYIMTIEYCIKFSFFRGRCRNQYLVLTAFAIKTACIRLGILLIKLSMKLFGIMFHSTNAVLKSLRLGVLDPPSTLS